MSTDTKPSNPKDIVGGRKLDMGLVPDAVSIGVAKAFLEGALKYGRYNWRVAGVSASTYHAALKRHLAKWWNGQNEDRVTRVHHLDNAMACIAIIRDAEIYGKLTDDRPPCPDPDAMARVIDEAEGVIAHLKEEFKAHTPKQYTIADTLKGPFSPEFAAEWKAAHEPPKVPRPVICTAQGCPGHESGAGVCEPMSLHKVDWNASDPAWVQKQQTL